MSRRTIEISKEHTTKLGFVMEQIAGDGVDITRNEAAEHCIDIAHELITKKNEYLDTEVSFILDEHHNKVLTYQPVIGGNEGLKYLDLKQAMNCIIEDIFDQLNITPPSSTLDLLIAAMVKMIPVKEGTHSVGTDHEIVIQFMDCDEYSHESSGY